ncbi:CheY-like chemotaxis protein [Pseudochelatococcus lubricantis]|uniref:CheY-like chemotaxis protein n=1 Tax=Pseudochelatococcus lubricantis TaxID=1538102 RepID=A0ABX0V0E6_9HYPH|nr:response regulator [Pseudochelatococcus lubricantis]NIJ57725.1 CheY-like chemotaxis protein [Pseudochelatococcus lubricantis]
MSGAVWTWWRAVNNFNKCSGGEKYRPHAGGGLLTWLGYATSGISAAGRARGNSDRTGNDGTGYAPSESRLIVEKKMVLIIDDDPAVLGALKFALEIEGYAVRCYTSPTEFLEAHDLPSNACLVVDEKMPGASGLDMLASLALERRSAMPAILITSYPSTTLRDRAQAQGIPIVEKPFLNNALSDAITAVMTSWKN